MSRNSLNGSSSPVSNLDSLIKRSETLLQSGLALMMASDELEKKDRQKESQAKREEARGHLEQVIEIWEGRVASARGSHIYVLALGNLGNAHRLLKDFVRAEGYFKLSAEEAGAFKDILSTIKNGEMTSYELAIFQRVFNLEDWARTLVDSGDLEKADEIFRLAVKVSADHRVTSSRSESMVWGCSGPSLVSRPWKASSRSGSASS